MSKDKQFAVIGLGRFGRSIARCLHGMGYEVLAVDRSYELVQSFSDVVTHVVQADTTDENALKALGIRNFDVVIVAIGEDMQANVLTVVQLKELGVPFVVAKARNLLHGKLLEKIGADSIVYPERDMAKRVAYSLTSRNIMDYIELSPDYSIAEVGVPRSIAGKSLIESNVRAKYGLNVVAIKRKEQLILPPNPHDVIEKDDIIVVVGSNEGMKRWEELK